MTTPCDFDVIEVGGKYQHTCRVCGYVVTTGRPSHLRTCRDADEIPDRWSREPCIFRGEVLKKIECGTCGNRTKMVDVFICTGLPAGQCTDKRTSAWPRIQQCFGCEAKIVPLLSAGS